MSQNDYVIANQTTPLFRSDLNSALQALASNSSGATAPTTTYANMIWYDTTTNILKMRSEADDAWIDLGTLDQGTNTFTPAGISTQLQATWDAGTDITESLISAAKLDAKINAEVPSILNATKISGNPYDYQEFTAGGTWTKPTNAETGDKVIVLGVGGGGGGGKDTTGVSDASGGNGGAGGAFRFDDIDDLGATESVVIGAGAAAGFGGGDTAFGTASTASFIRFNGGGAGNVNETDSDAAATIEKYSSAQSGTVTYASGEGRAESLAIDATGAIYGGGGGGRSSNSSVPSASMFGGHGGFGGGGATNAKNGEFPGGGGGGAQDGTAGAGADGIVRVWCVKETV